MTAALPTPYPGAVTAPTVRGTAAGIGVMGQGVMSGNTTIQMNEVPQVQKGLVWYNPGAAPLTRLMSKLKKPAVTQNVRYSLMEKQNLPRTATLDGVTGGAQSPTALSFASNEAYRFRVNDLIRNLTTGDIALVTAISDDDDITVTPNIGDAAPAASSWVSGQVVQQIGNAYVSGTDVGAAVHVIEDEKTFYTQIFEDPVRLERRYEQTELNEGNPFENARKATEKEHLLNIELARFFGKSSLTRDTTTGRLRGTMAGLKSLVNVNAVDFAGDTTITKSFFDKVLLGALKEGENGYENKEMATKTLFGSAKFIAAINAFADDDIQVIDPNQSTYGLRIAQLKGSWGILNLINAPVLNSHSTLAGMAFILDMAHVRPLLFKGRDTRFVDHIESNASAGERHEATYISDVGLVLEIAAAHAYLYGLA